MYAIYEQHGAQLSLFEDEGEEFLDLNEAEEILRQLRKDDPTEYERIANLPDGIRSGRISTQRGVFVFCQAGRFQQLFLVDSDGNVVSKDVPKVLGTIKCGKETESRSLPQDYNQAVMRLKAQFAEEAKHRQAELQHTLSLTHGQRYVLRELGVIFRTTDDEDIKAQINILEKAFRSPLTTAINREVNAARRNTVTGEELLKTLSRIYLQHNMREWLDRRPFETTERIVPRIICSEALV